MIDSNATRRDTIAEARTEWSKARPATAMAVLARGGSDMVDRRAILRAWGVSFDDQIYYSSDSFLRDAGYGPDGAELHTTNGEWCQCPACDENAPQALPRRYAVTVNVRHARTDGWASEFQLPTFYLDSNVQGIVSEEHAAGIARTVVDNMHVDGATYSITAVAL